MSSPATAAFLTEWRKRSRRPGALARIAFAAPSSQNIYLGTMQTHLGGVVYEAGLKCDPIRSRITRLGTGPDPSDTSIRIAARAFAGLGVTADVALSQWRWQGAAVTIWLWNDVRYDDGTRILADADKLQVFDGVIDSYSINDEEITLNLLQPRAFNKPIPPTRIDKISYPLAPDTSQGRVVPIVYGDFIALPMRSPHTTAYTNKQRQEDSGAGSGVVPGIIVDPGLAAATVKVIYASHACVDILSRTTGYSQFIAAGGSILSPLDTTGITETLGSDESYITINDDTMIAYYGARPLEPRTGANTATDPRRAADPFDETSYATITQPAAGVLQLTLPSGTQLGYIEAVDLICCFSGDAANANTFRVRPQTLGGASGTAVTSTLGQAQTITPVILTGTWDVNYWNQSWQFGGNASGVAWDIKCEFTGGAANKARVYWVALRVKYRPEQSVVTPASVAYAPVTGGKKERRPIGYGGTLVPSVARFEGQFFGNIKGYADTGGGTYTGTASALIERSCDIARHMLAVYGLESAFETGATAFGSFVYARSLLRNAAPNDYKLAAWIGDPTSVQQALQMICQQSLIATYRDRFSGNWMCHVWRRGGVRDYDLVLDRSHVAAIEAGISSDVELAQGIRVKWGYDHSSGRGLFETFVSATGSSQGFTLPTVIDQKLVVDATNEDIDWTVGGFTYAATLAHATYDEPIDLAVEIQTKMRAVSAGVETVGHGFTIKTGFNDTWRITRTAVNYDVVFAEGVYDADSLAREAALKLTAFGIPGTGTWTAVYDHATNLFTVTCGATCSFGNFYVMGMFAPASGTTATSFTACYADRFYFANWTGILKWLTGASTPTNCAELVGFTRLADQSITIGAGVPQKFAPLSRGSRQIACEASQDSYGPRADLEVDAPWVRDESSAQQLRDRIFDFGADPTPWVRITTHATPDLQRLRLIETSSDLDARLPLPQYASNGSWGGQLWRVLEVQQDMGPSYHTEFYAEKA